MEFENHPAWRWLSAAIACTALLLTGCGSSEAPPSEQTAATPAADSAAVETTAADAATPAAAPLESTDQTWTPEAMEALLAPIALYPDPVLSQVLLASTNPQEVLDAGNWLIANPDLEKKALDQAAEKAGFTPPMRGLMQFRQIIDQMCLEMGWTAELGQAFTNDEPGVFAAVQRLREQAQDVGNLQSSEQMKVETKSQDGQQAIVISPPSPQVVYVPQYDPVAAYAPPPATAAAPPPTTTTTTTTTAVAEDKGHSTGSMVATGLLAFGAGLVVANIFDDDDDDYYHNSNYYPNYYGGYMPPPPPYYYHPNYGNGYRPNNNYNRPQTYNKVLSDNNVVVVNNNKNNGYWNSFDDKPTGKARSKQVKSPISAAQPNRNVSQLNSRSNSSRDLGAQTSSRVAQTPKSTGAKPDWKGQSGYAGAKPEARQKAKLPPATAAKATNNANAAKAKATMPTQAADRGRAPNAGKSMPSSVAKPTLPSAKPANLPTSRPAAQPSRPAAQPSRPQTSSVGASANRGSAMSGSSRGGADRAASQRGRQSMPQGAHSKGAGAKRR